MGKRALMSENGPEPLRRSLGGASRKGQLKRGIRMMLRRAGLGLLVGAVLMASSGTSAGPALVFEPYNGTVFYAEDPDTQWFPASLTKLMTAYVAFQALKAGTVTPDTKLICSKEATEQAPSKLWLKVGESITLDVALKVLIVESANDVAVMIAEGVAGSQEAFVQRMNETAQHLGGEPISPTSTACPTSAKSPLPATLPSSRAPSSSSSPSTPICSLPSRFRWASRSCARITAY
jgi:hypothetical protein